MRYGPLVVNQVSMWADKLPGMADWLFSKPANEQQAQDLTNLSQAGNSASGGNPNGFDPNDPWESFRDLGLQNKDVDALQKAVAKDNSLFSLEKAYQDAQFLQQQGVQTTGHVLEQAQLRGISSQQISGIYQRSAGYGTQIYESATTGRYVIWSSTQKVAVIVDNASREVVTVFSRVAGPSSEWSRVNPLEIPQWLQLP